VYHPVVKGDYYEMGHGYGAVLHKHGFKIPVQTDEKLEFGRKSENEVKRVFPDILEEIKGFADACHGSYEQASAFMFGIGAFKPVPECSVFALSNASDVVFGRNYDFFYSFKKYSESYLTCPTEDYWSLGHSDVFIGREDGINEKGLAVAMTGVEGNVIKPGISFCLALRCVLDKCSTTDEAEKLLMAAHGSGACNYLLADKNAKLAVVETSPDKNRVRQPEEDSNFIVCTNHFVHPEMQDMENQQERQKSNWDTLPRYASICAAIKEKNDRINISDAQRILANHTGYVCSHQQKIGLGTIWSIVATLNEPQILRAEGHPCSAKFKPDLRLFKAMKKR
jgi:predicted choloylglycine hydrolase